MRRPPSPTIDALERRLEAMVEQGAPLAEMAEQWRAVYATTEPGDRYWMHEIAHEAGLGFETGDEWILDRDVTDPGPKEPTLQGLRAARYYRGFVLTSIIEPTPDRSAWNAEIDTFDPRNRRVHRHQSSGYPSLSAAFMAGMRVAKNEVDRLRVNHQPPAGRDPGAVLLGDPDAL